MQLQIILFLGRYMQYFRKTLKISIDCPTIMATYVARKPCEKKKNGSFNHVKI